MAVKKKSKYIGLLVYSKSSTVNIYKYANSTSQKIATAKRYVNGHKQSFGILTGFYVVKSTGTWFHLTVDNKKGWVLSSTITTAKASSSDSSAQNLINDLIKNDIGVRKSLTRSMALMGELQKKNQLPSNLQKKYSQLYARVSNREYKLKNSTLLRVQTGISSTYNKFMDDWGLSFLKISGIGVVPIVAWIIGGVVVAGLGAGVTAYFLSYHGESKVDLKISTDLEKALATLDPVTASKVKKDLQGQIDDSFSKGYTKGKGSTMFGNLKVLGFLLLGAVAAEKLIPKRAK